MSRPATSRLKVNPPLGRMPVLQNLLPSELQIDPTYQRNLETSPSQSLIRKIAVYWNWDLCQPLVVARRDNGDLFVIDGQHRLEAAKLRGDIQNLPAVVVQYANSADEAASFVHLNQQRRPLSKLDVFKAAIASGDVEACAIMSALTTVGLSVASGTNSNFWKPNQLINIGGIERAWRTQGHRAASKAIEIMGTAFKGQILRYAGKIVPGIAVVCADEIANPSGRDASALAQMLKSKSQTEWRELIYAEHAVHPTLSRRQAAERTIRIAWKNGADRPAPAPIPAPSPPKPRPAAIAKPLRVQSERLWSSIRDRSKSRDITVDPNLNRKAIEEWLRRQPNCLCCGVAFDCGQKNGVACQNSPSIDRFDPKGGYLISNLSLICWRCNNIKRNYSATELRLVARWMESWGNEVDKYEAAQ